MTETPFFFARDGARRFALLHTPDDRASASPSGTAFLFSHPFGEEKLWSHRVFLSLARALAARGHVVLRFDYRGAGDSSGMTPDTSLETHLEDLDVALAELLERRPETRSVGLVGLRLGATLAALFAEQSLAASRHPQLQNAPCVYWDPVLDGEAYFQELLRSNLSTQLAVYGKVRDSREVLQEQIRAGGTVNVDGYEIGKALFESCARTNLLVPGPRLHQGPALVVQIAANDKIKDREELRALAGGYARGVFARSIEQPFWREIRQFYGRAEQLQKTTLDWLDANHA